ncbi:MAG: rod shape-determining protein RodA [bacterium]
MKIFFEKFKKLDFFIIISAGLLLAVGILAIFSATHSKSGSSYVFRQLFSACAGIFLFLFFSWIDYRFLKKFSFLAFSLSVIVLLAVLAAGKTVNGAKSWMQIGAWRFQPVEFIKLAMIIVLAKFFSKNFKNLNQFKYVVASLFITFVPVGLVLLQPDPGSAFVIFAIWAGLVLTAGIRKRHMAILIFLALISSFLGWKFALKDYQKARITTFINPYEDPRGRGYNAIQSVIAVGSGGIWGKGIGNGSQGRLNFLPERHTDFIFANIAEEMGLVGAVFLLALYAVLLSRILRIALTANDNFARFLSIAIALMIFTHVLENIGMNIALMPITGIPLPLVSLGGSNLMVVMASLGIAQSVVIHKINPLETDF